MEYQLKVVDLCRSEGNKRFEAISKQAIALIYLDGFKDYGQAEKYANESLQLNEEFEDSYISQYLWALLSSIYLEQKRYKESVAMAFKAWVMDSTRLDIGLGVTANIATASMFIGKKEQALSFLTKYYDINKKLNDKSFHDSLMNIEVKYETEKKEIHIAALEKEKQLYIWLGITSATILLLAFGLLLVRHRLNLQRRRTAEQQVKQLEQEKQLVATQSVLDGETAERSRLARDLHDGLGGMLSVVKLNLKDIKNYSIIDAIDANRFDKALEILDESIGELRRVAHHIMPESLIRYGLKASLEDFCHAIPGASFQYFGEDSHLDSRLEVLLYRCAYELVNNAVKYANAMNINMQLIIDNGLVSLTVQDNGIGFDTETVTFGSGLENIRMRVAAYNGKINIYSTLGNGTEVTIEIEQV